MAIPLTGSASFAIPNVEHAQMELLLLLAQVVMTTDF